MPPPKMAAELAVIAQFTRASVPHIEDAAGVRADASAGNSQARDRRGHTRIHREDAEVRHHSAALHGQGTFPGPTIVTSAVELERPVLRRR